MAKMLKLYPQEHPILSYSQISTFLTCRKMWYWQYIEDLTPKRKTLPLMVGDLTHQLLDAYYQGKLDTQSFTNLKQQAANLYPSNDLSEVEEAVMQSAILLNGYVKQYQADELEVTSPEVWLEKDFGSFSLTARLDAICKTTDGRTWRMEHKTAGRVDKFYLKGQRRGLQTGISQWLMDELLTDKISGTIFNLLVKKKVPEFPRDLVPRSQLVIDMAKRTVHGVVNSLQYGNLYPSTQCIQYQRECDFLPLCQSDTPAVREHLYTSRKGVMKKSKTQKLI